MIIGMSAVKIASKCNVIIPYSGKVWRGESLENCDSPNQISTYN